MTIAIIIVDEDTPTERVQEFTKAIKPGIAAALRSNTKSGGVDLANSIEARMEGTRVIRIVSSKPYAGPLDKGTNPRTMWGLINKVVPLKLSGGTTIFRRVSLNSILRGKWRHPGQDGLHFVEKGAALARQRLSGPIGYRIVESPNTVDIL